MIYVYDVQLVLDIIFGLTRCEIGRKTIEAIVSRCNKMMVAPLVVGS
jgi:hypothetical protein